MAGDLLEEDPAEPLLLQQMPKLAHGGLVGHGLAPQIDPHKRPHRRRVVQRLFHRGVGEIEPVLQEVHAQHPLHAHGRPAVARFRVHGLDPSAQLSPRHHAVHLRQELRPASRLGVLLEARPGQRDLIG